MILTFPKRCRKQTTITARKRIWESRCGRYRVVEAVSLYGLPTIWYAMRLDGTCWDIVSQHRKGDTALEACRKHAKEILP